MTPKQNNLYWREWAAVHRARPSVQRHELHVQALGVDKSMTNLTNSDFDAVLGVFRAISRPADLDAQLRQLQQRRTRTLHSIRRHDAPLVASIALDRFGKTDLDLLTDEQLHQLATTLTERCCPQHRTASKKRAAARKAKKTEPVEEPF